MQTTQASDRTSNVSEARVTVLVTGEATGGRLVLLTTRETSGHEPPRHLHDHEDEVVYVLEGSLTFWIGAETRRVATGDCLLLPRGIEHGYAVESREARLLVVLSPTGLDGFLGLLETSHGRANVEQLVTTAARHGIAITGPAEVEDRADR